VNATDSSDFRVAMRITWGVAAAGVTSSLWPASDAPIAIGLLAAAVTGVASAAVRRELRIRRILAGIRPLPAQNTPDAEAAPAASSGNTREVA
jgi:hypothetical protein